MSVDTCTAPTVITFDNIHLSKPIPLGITRPRADDSIPLWLRGCTDPKVLELITAATASNSRRAYQSDLSHFTEWGGSIPAEAEFVSRYIAAHAKTLSVATLDRRLIAIRRAHVLGDFPDPTKAELIRLTLRVKQYLRGAQA